MAVSHKEIEKRPRPSILQLGCGHMGKALLSRWVESPLVEAEFFVVDRHPDKVPQDVSSFRDIDDLPADAQFDLVIMAFKPQDIGAYLPRCRALIREGGGLLSIAAGVKVETFEKELEDCDVVRMMPNLPVQVGLGMSGFYARASVAEATRALCQRLGEATGETLWLSDEDKLDRFTVVAGCGPGFVFELARNFVDAAKEQGFDDGEARKLVLATMAGSIELASQSESELGALRDAVTSKKGVTEAGLRELRKDGIVEGIFKDVLNAAYARVVEMRS